jgi:hypothetical protein
MLSLNSEISGCVAALVVKRQPVGCPRGQRSNRGIRRIRLRSCAPSAEPALFEWKGVEGCSLERKRSNRDVQKDLQCRFESGQPSANCRDRHQSPSRGNYNLKSGSCSSEYMVTA